MNDIVEGLQGGLVPLLVFLSGLACLLADLGRPGSRAKTWSPRIAKLGLLAATLVAGGQGMAGGVRLAPPESAPAALFAGSLIQDGFSSVLSVMVAVATMSVLWMSDSPRLLPGLRSGEFRGLVLFAASGALWMVQSVDLVTAFVSLEVLSVALYILAGIVRKDRKSGEAAVKYFLLGAFASAFLLLGIAFVYGSVGIVRKTMELPVNASLTNLGVISETVVLSASSGTPLTSMPLFAAGVVFLLVGLGFKASLAPFHQYAPDVYEGAPLPVAAFMATVTKFAAFGLLVRVVQSLANQGPASPTMVLLLGVLAVGSILVGNSAALVQTNLRRILAFSSTAHAGYLVAGTVGLLAIPGQLLTAETMLGYLLSYGIASIGVFSTIQWLEDRGHSVNSVADLAGLGKRLPLAAVVLTVLLLSFGGIPLTYGFIAKFGLFLAVVDSGQLGIAVAGLVASAVGIFVYLRLISAMLFREGDVNVDSGVTGPSKVLAVVAAIATVILGVVPARWIDPKPNPVRSDRVASTDSSSSTDNIPVQPSR